MKVVVGEFVDDFCFFVKWGNMVWVVWVLFFVVIWLLILVDMVDVYKLFV